MISPVDRSTPKFSALRLPAIRLPEELHARIIPELLAHHIRRAVGGAVVHHQDFQPLVPLIEHRAHRPAHHAILVVRRNDHGDGGVVVRRGGRRALVAARVPLPSREREDDGQPADAESHGDQEDRVHGELEADPVPCTT